MSKTFGWRKNRLNTSTSDRAPQAQFRIPELDAIRGAAVLSVVTFHFFLLPSKYGIQFLVHKDSFFLVYVYNAILSGWIGVDIFFVLSGFLITRILIESKTTKSYFFNFYYSRALRIFPLCFLLLAVWSVVSIAISLPEALNASSWHLASLWTYTANYYMAFNGWESMPGPVSHLWSLSVEEQFYLVWPFLIYFLSRRAAISLCLLMLLICPIIRTMTPTGWNAMAVVSTHARADALAFGCLVALAVDGRKKSKSGYILLPKWVRLALAASVFVLSTVLAGLYLKFDGIQGSDWFMLSFGFSCLSALTASLICFSVSTSNDNAFPSRGFLSRRGILRWFGKYSYGLYIVHQPLCILMLFSGFMNWTLPNDVESHPVSKLLIFISVPFVVSTLIAVAIFHVYEQPFLRLKSRTKRDSLSSAGDNIKAAREA